MAEIEIVLKNEATGELEKLRAVMKRVRDDVKKSTPIGLPNLKVLERTAYQIGREVGSTLREVGLHASFVSGGLVAILASIGRELDQFASKAVEQHAIAREVGLTYQQFERLVYAAKARGLSDEEARSQVENLARSVRDLARGIRSETRGRLELEGKDASGARLAERFQQSLAQNGAYKAILEVLQRMSTHAEGNEEGKRAAEIIGQAMGLKGAEWNHVLEVLDKIKRIAVPSEDASKRFLLRWRQTGNIFSRLRNRVLARLMPLFTRLMRYLASYFTRANTEKMVEFLRGLAKAFKDFDWDRIRNAIDSALRWIGRQIVIFATDFANFIEDIESLFQMVDRWRGESIWKRGLDKPVPFPDIGRLGGMIGFGPQGGGEANPVITLPEIEIDPDNAPSIIPPATEPQRFSARIDLELADDRLLRQTEGLSFELRRFTDVLRDVRGGAGGGSSDGGVSRKARTRPMQTKAGSAGTTTEDQQAAQTNPTNDPKIGAAVSAGAPRPGRHTVRGSWFGNYTPELGSKLSGGWDDPDDKYTSGPLKGKPKPNYGGYTQATPGVALPYLGTAGREGEREGAVVRVWSQDRKTSFMVRQIDVGPNQVNPRSKDKGIDINAALAERLGYVRNAKQARETGRPIFPTGASWTYEVVTPETFLRAKTEIDQQRRRVEGRTIPWSRHGKLDLEVNVKGERGTNVDASIDKDSDLQPGDQGVKINREPFSGGGGSFGGAGAGSDILL